MGMNNRGYFFVVDAILAAVVLAVGLFVLYGSYVRATPTEQAQDLIDDFATLAASQEVSASTNTYLRSTLIPAGVVLYSDSTLLEQVGYLHFKYLQTADPTYNTYARTFAESLVNESIDARYGAALVINGSTLHTRPIAKTDLFINKTTLLYVRMNNTYVAGPVIAEVHIWR